NGPTLSPEVIITSSSRPWNQTYPSSSIVAKSPDIYQPGNWKYSLYFFSFFQIFLIIDGQPALMHKDPICPRGTSFPSLSKIATSMPGNALPMEPGLIGMEG